MCRKYHRVLEGVHAEFPTESRLKYLTISNKAISLLPEQAEVVIVPAQSPEIKDRSTPNRTIEPQM